MLLAWATGATLSLIVAPPSIGAERPDPSSRGRLSQQALVPDQELPASCQFGDEVEPRQRRLKLIDRTAFELAREGCRRSATFRRLVRRIEQLRGVVYVVSKMKLPVATEGALLHRITVTPDGSRCLWIVVKRDRLSPYLVGVLGHELQHALEVLEDQDIRTAEEIEELFRRHRPSHQGQVLETDAALAAGEKVVSELVKR
jgi:hypothetical protein